MIKLKTKSNLVFRKIIINRNNNYSTNITIDHLVIS